MRNPPKRDIRDTLMLTVILSCVKTFISSDSFTRISRLFTSFFTILIIWAISVHVNEAYSQVKGQNLNKKIMISSAFSFLYCLWFFTISSEIMCVIPTMANKRVSSLSNCLVVSSDWLLFSFTAFLLEFTYLFIQIDSVGWADCLNSILAEEKIKAAVCEDWL